MGIKDIVATLCISYIVLVCFLCLQGWYDPRDEYLPYALSFLPHPVRFIIIAPIIMLNVLVEMCRSLMGIISLPFRLIWVVFIAIIRIAVNYGIQLIAAQKSTSPLL